MKVADMVCIAGLMLITFVGTGMMLIHLGDELRESNEIIIQLLNEIKENTYDCYIKELT